MSDNTVKVSYAAALFRVRVEFSRAATLASQLPPVDLLQRARAKMEAVQKEGQIGFFVTYEQRFEKAWAALRNATGEPESTVIGMSLAAGAPDLEQVIVDTAEDGGKSACLLTIDAPPQVVSGWKYEWVKLCVAQRMRELHLPGPANSAQILNAFKRAAAGEKISKFPIAPVVAVGPADDKSKFYSIVANKARREVMLIVRDVTPLLKSEAYDNLFQIIGTAAVKMTAATGDDYVVANKELQFALKNALVGPERVGIDMPFVALAASGSRKAATSSGVPKKRVYPGAGKLEVLTDEAKMEATIGTFSKSWYDDSSFTVNLEWLNAELDRLGIVFGRDPDLVKALTDKIGMREDLTGMVVARGKVGVGAKGPSIYPSFKDAKSSAAAAGVNVDKDVLNIRDMQQRTIVKVGQLVAEIRWSSPPQPGTNVYGNEIIPDTNETLSITLGEGIQSKDMLKFYATADGIPVIEGTTIGLSKVFVHNGDVNLRSGNVRFDGPVEIKGSVDSGALVEVRGHLTIHGQVRGGTIICTESVEIKGGIVTGPKAFVRVRGNLTAEFIENSRIMVTGELKVKKAVLNSEIIVGESIEVTDNDGIIAGGKISSRHMLKTAHLGFRRGAATDINVGVDYRIELRIRILTGRIEKVQAKLNDDRQALREIVAKKKEQMTARHEEMKLKLQKRLTKGRALVEKLEATLVNARGLLVYDQNAKIMVAGTLAQNCKVICGGNTVAVTHEVAGIAITPKRRRGSYIISIEELQKDDGGSKAAS